MKSKEKDKKSDFKILTKNMEEKKSLEKKMSQDNRELDGAYEKEHGEGDKERTF